MDESQLRNVWQNRQPRRRIYPLSEPLTQLMKRRLARRVRQIGQLSVAWDECIPDFIREHTGLVKFSRGTLTVAVDSAPHRYQLQQLLDGGLLGAIRERFPSGALNRVKLVPGRFDALEFPDDVRPQA
jgi:hypothetical protein